MVLKGSKKGQDIKGKGLGTKYLIIFKYSLLILNRLSFLKKVVILSYAFIKLTIFCNILKIIFLFQL